MLLRNIFLSLGLLGLVGAAAIPENSTGSNPTSNELPTIDLGYAVYRASYYNESYDAYIFSNIRFAAPPTGTLRFGAPQPPLKDRTTVHDGSIGFICPQAEPTYLPQAKSADPASEDCLFLDVIVPRKVLNGDLGDVPVLFWVFGGGYGLGSKTSMGDPITFLQDSPSPVVWVAPNYRLGLFGWLAGPTFTLSNGTVPNAGLYDQRFALEWVQSHIHLFHGKKDDVTIMGVSAGAGSIMHHITAYGGEGETLFKKAVPLGPGLFPVAGHSTAEEQYEGVEAAVNCTGKGVECIRAVDTATLQKINGELVGAFESPRVGYGPVIDGNYVPDLPSYLLAQGRFHKDITILVADDINEGYIFTNQNGSTGVSAIANIYPDITNTTLSEILTLYPPPSNTTPYTTEIERLTKIVGDIGFDCNRYALSAALADRAYNLVTSMQPGFHGTGATLLFSNVPGQEQVVSAQIQYEMRRFVMNFVVSGDPNEVGGGVGDGVVWPVFGKEGRGLDVGGWNMTVFDAGADRGVCEWWAKGLVFS